jgi:hypothetical protein
VIVPIAGDRPVLDPFNGFINHEHGHKEPFVRGDRIPEAILDLDIQPGRIEDSVDEVFKLCPINIGKLVGRDDFNVSHQEGRIEFGVGDARFNLAARHADLVQNVAVRGDHGIIGFASQDVDGAAC